MVCCVGRRKSRRVFEIEQVARGKKAGFTPIITQESVLYTYLWLITASCFLLSPVALHAEKKPLAHIAIDPGHGGKHLGACSKRHSFEEKLYTLPTARILQKKLERLGYRVSLTRNKDIFVSLSDRAAIANRCSADYFISIHYNSAPGKPEVQGIEVFYFGFQDDRPHKARTLANDVLQGLLKTTGAHSRGTKPARFTVLKETKMPAILVEGGFLTNADERAKIKDSRYLDKVAEGIAQGLHRYLCQTRLEKS